MDEQAQAGTDRFKDWMGVMVAVVALVAAIAAWRGAAAARVAGFEDYYGLTASLNMEQAQLLATARAIEHLTAFTTYAVNEELISQFLKADQENTSEAQRTVLAAQQEQAERLAATNRNFFPIRYANQDGTYALTREIAEGLADAERQQDLNPGPHLDLSSAQDSRTYGLVQIVILLGVALLAFTLAGLFHPARPRLRWSSAAVGAACLIVSVIAIAVVEWG